MIYWVIISTEGGQVLRRRPYSSQAIAEEYVRAVESEYRGHVIEIRPVPKGEFPGGPGRAGGVHGEMGIC